jgi:hypothetical protein
MRRQGWAFVIGAAVLAAAPLAGQAGRPTGAAWAAPRTVEGRPDLQGVWGNNTMTPLERPRQWAGRATISDAELADLQVKVKALLDGGDAFFFDELITAALEGRSKFTSADTQTGNYDQSWLSERVFDNRTSLVIDPPDGRIPPAAPGYAERARARLAALRDRGPADRVQDLSGSTRCIAASTPNLMAGYQSYFELTQGPGVVALRTEMMHDARIIPVDGSPHIGKAITQYHGDSRGRWEGDTLVVDTTNFSPNANFRGSTDGLHLTERFRRVSDDTLEYSVTIDDPTVWTRPWTAMMPLKRKAGELMFEYACHEGNYGLAAILRGARADERAAAGR